MQPLPARSMHRAEAKPRNSCPKFYYRSGGKLGSKDKVEWRPAWQTEKLNKELLSDPAVALLGIYLREWKTHLCGSLAHSCS